MLLDIESKGLGLLFENERHVQFLEEYVFRDMFIRYSNGERIDSILRSGLLNASPFSKLSERVYTTTLDYISLNDVSEVDRLVNALWVLSAFDCFSNGQYTLNIESALSLLPTAGFQKIYSYSGVDLKYHWAFFFFYKYENSKYIALIAVHPKDDRYFLDVPSMDEKNKINKL